eukprot:6178013-Pleurochrysis_carterae.AAC.2
MAARGARADSIRIKGECQASALTFLNRLRVFPPKVCGFDDSHAVSSNSMRHFTSVAGIVG